MAEPTLIVECAFASDPGAASPTWTNISQYVTEFQIRRGRQKELDRIDPGTCTLTLYNADRRFDPVYAAGPYYPNVLPMRKLRVRATHNAVTYNLFTGYVEAWPQEWPGGNVAAFTTITATDGFLPLSKADIGDDAYWPTEASGQRITRVLDAAGWPAADRVIDNGQSAIAATILGLGSGVTALEHAESVADSELGLFFCDGQGRAIFHDRHHRRQLSYLTAAGTFDDQGALPYTDLVPEYTIDRVWNDIRVAASGLAQQAEDATSQTKFLRRTMTRSAALITDTEAADQAAYLLTLYKDPLYRLTQMQLKPLTDSHWPQMLGREISDHVRVKRHPPPSGSAVIDQECFIESIEHRASQTVRTWETTWMLSTPAYTAIDWWLLEDATYGVLGTTTKLVY